MFPVLVSISNEDGVLLPGMNGEVTVVADQRNGLPRLVVVYGDSNKLRARVRELRDLQGRGVGIGGIRVRHRLDDDRVITPDRHVPDEPRGGATPRDGGHIHQMVSAIGCARHVHAVPRARWIPRP